MTRKRKWLIFGLTGVGICLFFTAVCISLFSKEHYDNGFIALLFTAGAILASLSWVDLAIHKIKNWVVVDAVCVNQELNKMMSPNQDMSGWVWVWRIKCIYNYAGEKYEVFPKIGWATVGFKNEKSAKKYLAKKIAPNNKCKLRVNPNDLQEAELLHN